MTPSAIARNAACAAATALLACAANAQDTPTDLNQVYAPGSGDPPPAERRSDWHGLLGGGVFTAQTAVGDSRTLPVPLVVVAYRDIAYWSIARGGVWLVRSEDRTARLGLALKLRGAWDPDDFDRTAGMRERDRSVEAGVTAAWATRPVVISAAYYRDVSGTTDGNSALLTLTHRFRVGERWSLAPSLGVEWLSADIVDYYYGVRADETTATRPAYTGRAAVNLRAGFGARYLLARDWVLLTGVSYTRLGSGITESPIVERSGVASVHAGAGWRF
jgi:outer membrane protein